MYQRILDKIFGSKSLKDFDPVFYGTYYKDLSEIPEHKLSRHFIKYGELEGRFPNKNTFAQEIDRIKNLNPEFNIVAYKYYNPDIMRAFDNDDDFILHYAVYGKSEGRKCAFDQDALDAHDGRDARVHPATAHQSNVDDSLTSGRELEQLGKPKMWEAIFSVTQAMAWFGDKLSPIPADKQAVMDAFRDHGISKLWPIQFSFTFDPVFYRSIIHMPDPDRLSDEKLYRHWLEEGLPSGLAPNPEAHLYAFLGGAPFPNDFDWAGYRSFASLPKTLTKYEVLRKLFESTNLSLSKLRPYLGESYISIMTLLGKHALANGMYAKSIIAFSDVIVKSPTSSVFCLLGDAYLRSGHPNDAFEAYKKSIDLENAPIWSYFNAIDILLEKKDFIELFVILLRANKFWSHKIEFSNKLDNCVSHYFEYESARAHRLLREINLNDVHCEVRETADRVMRLALDRIKNVFQNCDKLPADTGRSRDGYVLFLANDDLKQCTHYRIDQKLLQFKAAGLPIKYFSHRDTDKFLESLAGARAAIFYRVAAFPNILRSILHAKAMGLPTYYEIDDLLFDSSCYPDHFKSFEGQISREEYHGLQFGVPLFRYAMSECDNMVASTPALANQMKTIANKSKSLVVRNGLDHRNDIAIELGNWPVSRTDGRIRIFYGSGTKAHNADFNELVGPALIEIMERYDYVDLVIVGHLKLRPDLLAFGDRLKIYPFITDLNVYWSLLAACDINLAVLHAGLVADCKSEIKWLEAGVLQVPSVVTATATYRDVVEDGVDGLLAAEPADWLWHIEALVSDAQARCRVGAAARQRALADYSVEGAAAIWQAAFLPQNENHARFSPTPRPKIRVMVCNVFFHPQSIGGATRVVEDNVRTMCALYDDVEFGVFCSTDGDPNVGRMRMAHFNDVPVYRIGTPVEEGMDWRPFNEGNKAVFEEALDAFRPDIVHFHCIQRLTASIVEVAMARRIPYIVTLHDGWWISDHQFLVDADGFLQLPTTDVIADCESSKRPLQSIERRQRLRVLLQAADARLSVSAPFAKIYADAGIEDITVIENGIPALTPSPRRPRADGRVALGHIGGRAAHKGAFLIEAALRQGDYRNLHLTMVDGTMATGETVQTTWGGTPVTICGPYPQSKIADLYAQLDVLLAPSTWPESYGLVTREALSLGLWVVASEMGAIGQGVIENQNGHRIDVSTTAKIREVFEKIDNNKNMYKSEAAKVHSEQRLMSGQAKDLHYMYTSILSA